MINTLFWKNKEKIQSVLLYTIYKIHLAHERSDCKRSNIKILPLSTFPLETRGLLVYAFLPIGLKGNENRWVMTCTADLLTKKMTQDLAFVKF